MSSPEILVGRAWRGKACSDLRPAGMRLSQRGREGDAGAGNLRAGRMRKGERRGDGDSGAAPAAGRGGDNRRLVVRATVNGNGLAGAKASPAGNRENGRSH